MRKNILKATILSGLIWHTAIYSGLEDVTALLNCLPAAQAESAKVISYPYTSPVTGRTLAYSGVLYLDTPTVDCSQVDDECKVRCLDE